MRIAYVCADSGIPVWGSKGASAHVRGVVRALRRRGDDVTVFTPRPGGHAPPDLADVDVVVLPTVPRGPVAAREEHAIAANELLLAALEDSGPFDLVYERYSLWSVAGMVYAHDRATVRSLLEVNAPLIDEQERHRALHDRAAAERRARTAFRLADAVVAVSEPVAAWARSLGAVRAAVVPNGVDVDRFAIAPAPADDPETFTVAFSGSLKPWHGVDVLLHAVADITQDGAAVGTRLLIVGDGPQRGTIETLIDDLGLRPVVTLTGAVDPDDVPGWLMRADVGAAPYPADADAYFSPLKVVEYLGASLPVVASAVGQIPFLLDGERAGLLAPAGDAAALANALRTLRDDRALRRRLGEHGRALAGRRHTWDGVVADSMALVGVVPATSGAV